jgi:glutamine synthetase
MTGAPDVVVVPDATTFTELPWSPGTAWLTGDLVFPGGEPLPYSTRGLLGRAVAAAAAQGFEAVVGIEMEFHLTRLDTDAGPRDTGGMGAPGSATAVLPTSSGYQHQAEADVDDVDDFLRVLQDDLEALGLPLRTLESELGPSQFEVTFEPLPAMRAADTAFLFRTATKQLAKRHGYHVTFMSRPLLPGAFSSGWHLHLSLTDAATGRNLFVPDEDGQLLSALGRHFTAGLLNHARASAVLTTPTVTGFKRFRTNSLAPDRANWGSDQRGAMIRVSGVDKDPNTHIENRVGDPSANPYLYVGSQILSGLDGLRRGEEPPDPTDEPYQTQAPSLPSSLGEAIEEFASSEFYRQAAGAEFVDFYVAHKRSEHERYSASERPDSGEPSDVGEWEHREYFDLH